MLNRNRMASQHNFAMIPRSDIPRSTYLLQQKLLTTFNGGDLIPIYVLEVLPGDQFNGDFSVVARGATPITPVMDNAELETWFWFVPNRLTWEHWEDFIGGGNYTIPTLNNYGSTSIGPGTIYDYMGLPGNGQILGGLGNIISALPFRAYNLIYNEWYRDQNLTTAAPQHTGDGPDAIGDYTLLKRAKKHDYFTGCLPWPQKGTAVSIPLGTTAPVIADGTNGPQFRATGVTWPGPAIQSGLNANNASANVAWNLGNAAGSGTVYWGTQTGLLADLSNATAQTINALRAAFQVQRLLERDARGGTRYTEIIQSQFGVRPPDFRLERPEYIGGGRSQVNTNQVTQTSETADTPQGNVAGVTTIIGQGHRFRYAATEHGYIIGLANVRTDLSYQQGIARHFTRSTRYDFYTPVFAHLGEQAVLRREIFATGTDDTTVFGYQERWAEYRYTPNQITGLFRSTATGNIDEWHYAEQFGSAPSLNNTFITDPSQTTMARTMAVGSAANGQQIIMDGLFRVRATRPMPTYSVPGLIDHF